MGQSPGFLSNDINRQDKKSLHCMISTQFLNYICKCLTEITTLCPKLLEVRIPRKPSKSIPDGPEPRLVLIAAFLIIPSSIDWNLTR